MKSRGIILGIIFVLALAATAYAAPDPDGATLTVGTAETKPTTAPGSTQAEGGNITGVNLTALAKSRVWQGFFGSVSGNITLQDNTNDQFYSWTLETVNGSVFASQTSAVNWTSVSGVTNCSTDQNVSGNGNDRVNRTFTQNASLTGWSVAGITITDACQTWTYVNNASQSTYFEEIMLNASNAYSIYATKINFNTTGYNNATQDYQMLVPDTRNVSTTTYYFYVEFT